MNRPGVLESDNYAMAHDLAARKLRAMDPVAVARRAGAEWTAVAKAPGAEATGEYRLPFFAVEHRVEMPAARVFRGGEEAPIWDAILVLHYLGSEGPVPPAGEPIAFKEIPNGGVYDAAFRRRSWQPLVRVFGSNPAGLVDAAAALGGRAWDRGDASVVVRAFPRVDVYVVLYRGDDEFPPDGAMLFSSNVAAFLSTEDVAVLGGMLAGRLGNASRGLGG